jgi:hypothetical protein
MTKTIRRVFQVCDRVELTRPINGRYNSFKLAAGCQGTIAQIYQSGAMRIAFDDTKIMPVVAARYLRKVKTNETKTND